jgi:serine/threonine protein kinase
LSSTGRLSIEVVGGHSAPAQLPSSGRLSLGSGKSAGYPVDGQGVADVHCTIGRIKGGGWALKDLGSDFGTFVNGKKVDSCRLQEGDTILMGSTRLRIFDPLHASDEAAPARTLETSPELERKPKRKPEPAARPNAVPRSADKTISVEGYRVESMLGSGGMGMVYLAEQTRLGRKVALKVLSPKLEADEAFVRDFQEEARSAAALNHPNVVTIFDVGEADSHHYLSMEYMDKGCLESRIAELGPIPWREVLGILRDSASGLVYAESRGIVHRDIKPANLMQNQDGVTKLADLGLAVQVEKESVREEGRKLQGTPHFIAPELIRGGVADSRSDLYSLGATAYRLLSGHTPFEGTTTKEILRGSLRDEPNPLRDLVNDVPANFAALVHRLLEKDPADRHPSAQILLDDLNRLIGGGPNQTIVVKRSSSLLPALLGLLAVAGVGAIAMKVLGPNTAVDPGNSTNSPADSSVSANAKMPNALDIEEGGLDVSQPKADETVDLRVSEADATLRYFGLAEQQLTDDERVVQLRALADDFDGTDMAARARKEALELERVARYAARADAAKGTMRSNAITALRAVSRLESEPPQTGKALTAMIAVPLAAELFLDQQFVTERNTLLQTVIERGAKFGKTTQATLKAREAQGDFDGVQKALESFLATADYPTFPSDEPAGMSALRVMKSEFQTRLDTLEESRESFTRLQEVLDRTRIGHALGGSDGLEQDLASMNFNAAISRLEGVRAQLIGEDNRQRVDATLTELRLAGASFQALGSAWTQGDWQRTMVSDPRDTRARSAEAVGADERGVVLKTSTGTDQVAWSAWANNPRAINQLFKSRLDRPWDTNERTGIATCLRISATIKALQPALASWRNAGDPLNERDLRKMLAVFEDAEDWDEASSADRKRLADEKTAIELLAFALIAQGEGSPARAVDALERLLGNYPHTLVVTLLSDGSDWQSAVATAEVETPADSTEPEDSESATPPGPEDSALEEASEEDHQNTRQSRGGQR